MRISPRRLPAPHLRALLLPILLAPATLGAQTEYYDLEAGAPVRVEDAYAGERGALELHLGRLRWDRIDGGGRQLEVDPHIAFGILPRTRVGVGLPFVWADRAEGRRDGLSAVEVDALHTVRVESPRLPALGVALGVRVPAGGVDGERVRAGAKGIATRSFGALRAHLNVGYGAFLGGCEPATDGAPCPTFVDDGHACTLNADAPRPDARLACMPREDVAPALLSSHETEDRGARWTYGLAVDRALPLRSVLLVADVTATRWVDGGRPVEWSAETGFRLQLSPRVVVDAGIGRRFTGGSRAWFFTVGHGFETAIGALLPGRGR